MRKPHETQQQEHPTGKYLTRLSHRSRRGAGPGGAAGPLRFSKPLRLPPKIIQPALLKRFRQSWPWCEDIVIACDAQYQKSEPKISRWDVRQRGIR